jgi:hypothetical protein
LFIKSEFIWIAYPTPTPSGDGCEALPTPFAAAHATPLPTPKGTKEVGRGVGCKKNKKRYGIRINFADSKNFFITKNFITLFLVTLFKNYFLFLTY